MWGCFRLCVFRRQHEDGGEAAVIPAALDGAAAALTDLINGANSDTGGLLPLPGENIAAAVLLDITVKAVCDDYREDMGLGFAAQMDVSVFGNGLPAGHSIRKDRIYHRKRYSGGWPRAYASYHA